MQADPWTRLVPDMFRSLADPAQRQFFPRPENTGLENACASWGALNYALCSLLGWRDVGTGLARWYRAGKPVADSPVLSFIQEVWGEDNMLEYYAAWAWKPRDSGWLVPQSVSISEGPSPHWLATNSRYWQDEDWWRAFVRRGKVHSHDPFYGGTDSLHLGMHSGPPVSDSSGESVYARTTQPRHVLLVVGSVDHWLADLIELGKQLPSLPDRSWQVDVFDRQVGYLGRYRQSRETGLWFTGRHSVHMWGQP